MRAIIGAALCALACGPAFSQGMGYARQQEREIKALSAQDQADLLAGRGMGLAKAGELNHYPGPAHILELRDKLAITPQQFVAVRDSFDRMSAAAKPLGAEILGRERELDSAFRDGRITPAALAKQTSDIAEIEGRLRAVHLAAHLEMRSVLTPGQIAAYDMLRGYANAAPMPPGGHSGMHPG